MLVNRATKGACCRVIVCLSGGWVIGVQWESNSFTAFAFTLEWALIAVGEFFHKFPKSGNYPTRSQYIRLGRSE